MLSMKTVHIILAHLEVTTCVLLKLAGQFRFIRSTNIWQGLSVLLLMEGAQRLTFAS